MPRRVLAAAAALLVLGAAPAAARTTLERTIRATAPPAAGSYAELSFGPGEPHVVRSELAGAGAGDAARRAARRRSLLYFAQLSDFQLVDEESPARVETTDPLGSIFTSAWRPQEALHPWTVDAAIRQVNAHERSPVRDGNRRRARLALAIDTGDSADNQQRNEVEWVVRLLEGGRLDPNSGSTDPRDHRACPPGTPGPRTARRYTGVQDYSDHAPTPGFYDPDRPVGPWASWPRLPGLLDRVQEPFRATGLRVPHYQSLGNHDALIQGNFGATTEANRVATGCVKLLVPAGQAGDIAAALDPQVLEGLRSGPSPRARLVPPDPRRAFVSKRGYRRIFARGGQRDDHGFAYVSGAERRASNGSASYYAWTPRRGFRFVALDTVAEAGLSSGNVDDPQFRWLERELRGASRRNELVVVFGHHAVGSMTAAGADETGRNDPDPRPSTPIHLGGDVRDLLLRFPHVVAFVAGHSHRNDVEAFPRADAAGGGFWMIRTAAEADWPVQQRLLEVFDNRDGTLSIFGTIIDGAAPARAPRSGPARRLDRLELAALARTLSYNDPQAGGGRSSERDDRNVELLLRDPRRR